MLQSIHMTSINSDKNVKINSDYIYKVTGSVSPKDIDFILQTLLQDEIKEGFNSKYLTILYNFIRNKQHMFK